MDKTVYLKSDRSRPRHRKRDRTPAPSFPLESCENLREGFTGRPGSEYLAHTE